MKIFIKLILVFYVFLYNINCSVAQQVAGYRGKHFMAGYTANFGHNIFSNDFFGMNDKFRVHIRHGISGEYITNRFTTIGGEISYINTPVGSYTERDGWQEITGSRRFVSMSAGATIKQYFGIRNGLIAPIGGYSKGKIFIERLYFENTMNNVKSKTNKYWSPGLGVAYGQSRVIKNAVRLDAAIEFEALLGTFAPAGDIFVKGTPIYNRNLMAFYHLFGYSSTFRLGVSGLLF